MPKHLLIFSIVILLLGAGWVWSSRETTGRTTGGLIPAPQNGFLAPDFDLPARGDSTIKLSQLRGRPVVLNFWASWCPPCRAEMPALQRVFNEYQNQDLVILGINATTQDSMADAIGFADQNNLTFPIAFDPGGQASHDYQIRSLPATYFVDRQGIIQEVIVGGPISEALLRIRVEKLLRSEP